MNPPADASAPARVSDKVVAGDHLLQRAAQLRRPMVFTNGVFDLLHRGHVTYLHEARRLGASLLVAINSDASARRLGKGPNRPLNTHLDRAMVLAGLESVDLVTWFDDPIPLPLIAQLKPDIYVKGGDYRIDQLAEVRLVQSWGGAARTIDYVAGYSTTGLVNRVRGAGRKAAFLDRDGVINLDRGYVYQWQDCEWVPGALDGMRLLRAAGFVLVIVTNQSGIARGLFSESQYQAFTDRFVDALAGDGVHIDKVYHCPHHPEGSVAQYALACDCRKPLPGMLNRAIRELSISAADSVLFGDQPSDIAAGRQAGIGRVIGVRTDGLRTLETVQGADETHDTLLEAASASLRSVAM